MEVENLIIHCTATPEGRSVSKSELMSWFTDPAPKGKGWSKPGYRTMIHVDGSSSDLLDYNNDNNLEWSEVTYGAKGFNSNSIHITYVGGVRKDNIKIPKDTRTDEQKRTLRAQVEYYLGYYPNIKIFGHYRINKYKACPSFDTDNWLKSLDIPERNIGIDAKIMPLNLPVKDTGFFDFNIE